MDTTDIIEAFGGAAGLSKALGLSRVAVHNWKRKGIPAGRWPQLRKLAAERGLARPFHDAHGTRRPGITIETLIDSKPRQPGGGSPQPKSADRKAAAPQRG